VLLLDYENRSTAETLSGMSCWPVSPLFRLKSALPTLCPQDVFHTMHGGLAKRLLLILVHLLTVAALQELDRLLRHLTLPAGEHRIPSLHHLKKWGFSDAARFVNCFCSCFSVSLLSCYRLLSLYSCSSSFCVRFHSSSLHSIHVFFFFVLDVTGQLLAVSSFGACHFPHRRSICDHGPQHVLLHGAKVAENFGTWSNVSTAPREALHKYNKMVRHFLDSLFLFVCFHGCLVVCFICLLVCLLACLFVPVFLLFCQSD
jgi:hypothetical protein